jgi:hypothetical protein
MERKCGFVDSEAAEVLKFFEGVLLYFFGIFPAFVSHFSSFFQHFVRFCRPFLFYIFFLHFFFHLNPTAHVIAQQKQVDDPMHPGPRCRSLQDDL